MNKLTLKQAQEQNKLEEFIQQQEDSNTGDEELFDNTLKSMLESGKKKQDHQTSQQPQDCEH
jgi:LPS O-antigen subunit length determinant protein (WzzB/FepE family)